ncbi:M20 family metallo-hydrolase [Thauera sp.]|uniref:M20 family metallo-hydrolase n=1 Tax=Thauera sp. TaxID=1905334 RepID=UPI0039E5AD50
MNTARQHSAGQMAGPDLAPPVDADILARAMASVDGERFIANLQRLASFGGRDGEQSAERGIGVCRQALGAEELRAKQWLCGLFFGEAYRWTQDAIGNLFLRRRGLDERLAPLLIGSHIDTQPTGGWLDGAYGVMAGYELCMALDTAGVDTLRGIEIAAWTNEEGSRFAPGAMGSSAFVRPELLETYLEARDAGGCSVRAEVDALQAALPGAGMVPLGHPVHAYLEAHIEQGPVMEANGTTLAVVEAIQGVRWYQVKVRGRSAHAGTTPRDARQDALLAAAQLITELDRRVHELADARLRWTVGQITARPGAINTIAQEVEFSIDLRHPEIEVLERIEAALKQMLETAAGGGCRTQLGCLMARSPTLFHSAALAAVEAGVRAAGEPFCTMTSGAFHDAMYLADACPAAMLFVPSIGGISHHPDEHTQHMHLIAGARALTAAALHLAR